MAPSQSTIVTGLQGGAHNNTNLEMGFIEKEGKRDTEKRTYNPSSAGSTLPIRGTQAKTDESLLTPGFV